MNVPEEEVASALLSSQLTMACEMMDKLNQCCSEMLQAVPPSWSDHPHGGGVVAPTTMDFAYDGLYNAFTPYCNTAFPSTALTQTLCELDIDNSIHKLFEGLPEILEDRYGEGVSAARLGPVDAVTVVAPAPFFPSTPPAQQCSRPSSVDDTFMTPQNATPAMRAPASKAVRARKGKATAGSARRSDAKVPGSARTSLKVLDAIVPMISVAAVPLQPPRAHGVCPVPRILPAASMDLRAVKTTCETVPIVGLGPQAVLHIPKRARKDPPTQMATTRTQNTRYFDKVEHIVRERWRRDDMAGKFLALESLLPPGSKRDRSTIVEDSMKLVKSLQHRKEDALKRCAELKLAAQLPGVKLNRIIQKIGSLAAVPAHGSGGGGALAESPSSSSMMLSAGTKRPLEATTTSDPGQQIPPLLRSCVKRFYVHSELGTGDILMEMICEQIPHFHSVLLESMETLGLDVIRCSVTKTINKLICNITVKPFANPASVKLSSTSIMEGLSSAFLKD